MHVIRLYIFFLFQVNMISQIRNCISEGETILMCKTDEIHESFYGLFNLRYTTIIDPEDNSKSRFFTNIAIGANSKPSQVNPKFQCVVVVKKSELDFIPPPFLNRFEKYTLSHRSVLETVLEELPPYMKTLLKIIYDKVCICLFVCLFVCVFTCLLARSLLFRYVVSSVP